MGRKPLVAVVLLVAAIVAASASGAGLRGLTPKHPDCPGSVGGRVLAGTSDVGIPGEWIQGSETSVGIKCFYPGPGSEYSLDVNWITPANPGHEFYGCGEKPRDPSTTVVSAKFEAYASINTAAAGADFLAAAQAMLTQAEQYAKPCTPPKPQQTAFTFGFRIANTKLGVSAGSHGSFKASGDPEGTQTVTSVSAKAFAFTVRGNHKRYRFVVRFTGTGTYKALTHSHDLTLDTTVTSTEPGCSGKGQLSLTDQGVFLELCGTVVPFEAPKHSTAWVKKS